mgnify:CR=1 FL=1
MTFDSFVRFLSRFFSFNILIVDDGREGKYVVIDDGKSLERELNRKAYDEDIHSLKLYVKDLNSVITELRHESSCILKAHQMHMNGWRGQAREMYDALLDDLDRVEFRVYDRLRTVKQRVAEEIERLQLEAGEL